MPRDHDRDAQGLASRAQSARRPSPRGADRPAERLAGRRGAPTGEGAVTPTAAHDLLASPDDPLSDALKTVRLTGAIFFAWDVSWPFAMALPSGRTFASIVLPGAQQIVSYHVVTGGECWASSPGGVPMRLTTGDVLVVPQGEPYTMAHDASACRSARVDQAYLDGFFSAMAAGEIPFVVKDGGGLDATTHVLCGFLGCDMAPFNPMLAWLPPVVRLPARTDDDASLSTLIALATREARDPRPGSRSVLTRLSELMFIEVLRRAMTEHPTTDEGWLAGLKDPVVGRALVLMHRRPTERWSVETLARAAGTSRSRLADAFSLRLGCPPIRYLALWRLQLATQRLAETTDTVSQIASAVGYESEAAFSRAFKRVMGIAPTAWRNSGERTARPVPSADDFDDDII